MSQKGNAGKDLVQIGRDYFKHIQLNILSGNWGLVIIALIPLLLFLYGVKATGDTVAGFVGAKPSLSELSQNGDLLQVKDAEIGKLKKQVEDLQRTDGASAKNQKQVEAPPSGTAPKSWCLQVASIVKGNADLGMDTSGMKAAMEEQNCRFWGVSTP